MINSTQEIVVSVICLTYNHKDFIKTALEGFVKQQTSFRFEVIVHDDASTDGTTEIVQEYAEKYPNIIVPIFQTQNQHSLGVHIVDTYVVPVVKGKYIAICEGDDYWCDEKKLQRQVVFLEEHQDYVACAHNTLVYNYDTKEQWYWSDATEDCTLKTTDIIRWKIKGTFHTSSIMYRAEYLTRPCEFNLDEVGDYPLAIWLAISGKIYFFSETMSVYRIGVPGSYTKRIHSGNSQEKIKEHYLNRIRMLSQIDKYTDERYHGVISEVCEGLWVDIYTIDKNYHQLLKKHFQYISNNFSIKAKIILMLKVFFPKVWDLYVRRKATK